MYNPNEIVRRNLFRDRPPERPPDCGDLQRLRILLANPLLTEQEAADCPMAEAVPAKMGRWPAE